MRILKRVEKVCRRSVFVSEDLIVYESSSRCAVFYASLIQIRWQRSTSARCMIAFEGGEIFGIGVQCRTLHQSHAGSNHHVLGRYISARSLSAGGEMNSFADKEHVCVSIHAHLFHYSYHTYNQNPVSCSLFTTLRSHCCYIELSIMKSEADDVPSRK